MRMKRAAASWAVAIGLGLAVLPPVRSAVDEGFRQIKLIVDVLQTIQEQYVGA